jgi:hypothetical protein
MAQFVENHASPVTCAACTQRSQHDLVGFSSKHDIPPQERLARNQFDWHPQGIILQYFYDVTTYVGCCGTVLQTTTGHIIGNYCIIVKSTSPDSPLYGMHCMIQLLHEEL